MKRSGFTMIELIFVIVILGILAAVALPKFIGVASQAQAGKLSAFVGTLNRTTAPAMWSMSLANKDNGSLAAGAASGVSYDTELLAQIETPTNVGDTALTDLLPPVPSQCLPFQADTSGNGVWEDNEILATWTSALTQQVVIGGTTYDILCIDGSGTESPRFALQNVTDGVIVTK